MPSPYRRLRRPRPVRRNPRSKRSPAAPPTTVEEPQPLPAAACASRRSAPRRAHWSVRRRRSWRRRIIAVAASSIERALRIEPDNPLLWIELGKVRLAEGNYVQAENMGRKAVSMSVNAPRAQSAAWRLIADSLRARGKNSRGAAKHKRARRRH